MARGEPYDVALVDATLPGRDGGALARAPVPVVILAPLRERGEDASRPPPQVRILYRRTRQDMPCLLEEVEDHEHAVGHCYRCASVVEPRLSLQWFVKMKPLAKPAIEAYVAEHADFRRNRHAPSTET